MLCVDLTIFGYASLYLSLLKVPRLLIPLLKILTYLKFEKDKDIMIFSSPTMNIFILSTVTALSTLPISEDYGSSKSSGTVSHQSLPAFSQPFGSRSSFRGYSPPFSSSQQNTTGTVTGAAVETASWTYATPTSDPMTTQYATPSRRQTVNPVSAPTQLSAAASLTASE